MSEREKSVDFWVEELTKKADPELFGLTDEDFYYYTTRKKNYSHWMWNCGYNAGLVNLQTKVNTYCIPQWIRVEDKLPEKHGWYLTAHEKTYPTDSGVKICFFCHGYFKTDKEVTHWRPLPEYPESEDDTK